MQFLTTEFQSNPVWAWFLAAGLVAFVWLVLRIAMRRLIARLRTIADRSPGRYDDLVVQLMDKTKFLFVLVVAFYVGTLVLDLPEAAESGLHSVFIVALLIQAGYWGDGLVTFYIRRMAQRKLEENAAAATSLTALRFVAKILVWTVVVLLALDNFGIDITALIAGLGIGGVAIALAVQNILGDLFASLSIIVDKPFVIGDFIIVGDQLGTVERIGLKTTRVRSLYGEEIVFSNSDLLSSRVRNYKRMFERRITFPFGVVYQTSPDVLEGIPQTVRGIIEELPDVRFDRCHFKSFGDFSLDFETVYYVLSPDYNLYMDRQQSINLGIARAFEAQGIEFAYPTQTVFLEREDGSQQE